jgi:hypothetical protein
VLLPNILTLPHFHVLTLPPYSSIHLKKKDRANTVEQYLGNVKVLLSCWDKSAGRLSNILTAQVGHVTLILMKERIPNEV